METQTTPTQAALTKPLPSCLSRLRVDLKSLYKDPLPGVFVQVNDEDMTKIDALITGPSETPYEGGFFWFKMDIPFDYPNNPPRVENMTTDFGRVRFNPNLYSNGKVCLSILNTYSGPSWSPAQSISSVLLSIQSLLTPKPYCNEPGFENPRNPRDADAYSEFVRHETIRVAFCDILEQDSIASKALPPAFLDLVREVGPSFFSLHEEYCRKRMRTDGSPMFDPYLRNQDVFRWGKLLKRIETLKVAFPQSEDEDKEEEEEE